jgi:hypothetical protein
MCAINRVSSEPPSHIECARYSVLVCPFLTNPKKRRREGNKPDHVEAAGVMLDRNPGVSLLWSSKSWKPFRVPEEHGGGVLFDVGTPTSVEWWAEGRKATRDEIMASIDSGLPLLLESAERDGPKAVAQLNAMKATAMKLVPA